MVNEENQLITSTTIDGGTTNLTPIEIMLQVDENGETTARKLYEFLQLDKSNFSKWVKRNITENIYAIENIDFVRLVLDDETPTGGKIQRDDYKLTASFAKKLCMTSQTPRGEQARNYFVKVESILKEKSNKQSLVVPTDYEEALEALLKSVKEKKKLLEQNSILQQEVETAKPKVEMYERLMNGKNAIEMNEVSKTLGVTGLGRNNLFKVLRGTGVLMSNNVPYQKYLGDRGLFKVIFTSVRIGEHIENKPKTLVTAKGLEYLHKKLKENGYITEINYIESSKQLN